MSRATAPRPEFEQQRRAGRADPVGGPAGGEAPRRCRRRRPPRSARRPRRAARPDGTDQEDHLEGLVSHQREVGGGAEERQRTSQGSPATSRRPSPTSPTSAARRTIRAVGRRLAVPDPRQTEQRHEEGRRVGEHPVHRARQLGDQTTGAEPGDLRRRRRCRAAWRCPRPGRRAPGGWGGRRCRRSGRTPPPRPPAARRSAAGPKLSRPTTRRPGRPRRGRSEAPRRPASPACAATGPPRRRPAGR